MDPKNESTAEVDTILTPMPKIQARSDDNMSVPNGKILSENFRLSRPLTQPDRDRMDRERSERDQQAYILAETRRRLKNWDLACEAIGTRYRECTFETFQISADPEIGPRQTNSVQRCLAFCSDIKANVDAGRGLILFGPVGTGKDHLLVATMREACRAGYRVAWRNGPDLHAAVRESTFGNASIEDLVRGCVQTDILAISDVVPAAGELAAFQVEFLTRVIDDRYRALKPIWLTVNVASSKDLEARLGSAINRRIVESAFSVGCFWPCWRRTADGS